MTNRINCQTAQEQLQELLDQRWAEPISHELQEHLSDCPPCQGMHAIFRTLGLPGQQHHTVPTNFAPNVVARYSREQRRGRWFRTSSFLAVAAALFAAVTLWVINTQLNHVARTIKPNEQSQDVPARLFDAMRKDYVAIQSQFSSFSTPNLTIPDTLTSAWELPDLDDPLAIGLPAMRTIGATFQGAVEPYEAPARAVLQKVKDWIDDPELKKVVEKVKRRLT